MGDSHRQNRIFSKSTAIIILWLTSASPRCCSGWSLHTAAAISVGTGNRLSRPARTTLWYQKEHDQYLEDASTTTALHLDLDFLEPHKDDLTNWLCSLSALERSEPLWVGTHLLHLSPSAVLQHCLDSITENHNHNFKTSLELFPAEQVTSKYTFDWAWRYALIKLLKQNQEWNKVVSKQGISNTHPLRLSLVAIPPHTTLQPHVHPGVELDIPILGTLYEERPKAVVQEEKENGEPSLSLSSSSFLVDSDLLDRAPEHSLGTPLSDFSPQPTAHELQLISQDLSQRVSEYYADNKTNNHHHHPVLLPDIEQWHEGSIPAGECLVNKVGSVHRSFTRDEPCLLFVLGPNVHAHWLPQKEEKG